jgi:hypothetical protein
MPTSGECLNVNRKCQHASQRHGGGSPFSFPDSIPQAARHAVKNPGFCTDEFLFLGSDQAERGRHTDVLLTGFARLEKGESRARLAVVDKARGITGMEIRPH